MDEIPTKSHLLSQTAKIRWAELQRAFAQGRVLVVDADVDLIATGEQIVLDNASGIENLIRQGKLSSVALDEAKQWHQQNQQFWSVVVAPWVLIQIVATDGE